MRIKRRTRRPAPTAESLTDGQLEHLCEGRDFFGEGFGKGEEAYELLREAWTKHWRKVLAYHEKNRYSPAEPCWAREEFGEVE